MKFIDVDAAPGISRKLFLIIEDMFYQRLTTDNFTLPWMETLSYELKNIIAALSIPTE